MSEFINEWFQWFEKGINDLDPKEREKFFCRCGRGCADTGIKKIYEDLYKASGKKLDTFFPSLNELDDIGGKVVKPGEIYEISFPRCLCDLHKLGYVHSDTICECSRQSILYVMSSLEPGVQFQVDKIATVLGGNKECRFRITIR